MTSELYDKIQNIQVNDKVSIADNLGKFIGISKVREVDSTRLKTKDYTFLKSTGEAVNIFKNYYKIDDVYFDLFNHIITYLKSKKFNLIEEDYNYFDLEKTKDFNITNIRVFKISNNYKDRIQLVIYCNSITLFSGDIKTIKELEVIYDCTIKKLE